LLPYAEIFKLLRDSKPFRYLSIFGIALPFGIITVCRELWDRNWLTLKAAQSVAIVAGFWLILGMLVTGIYLIRSAIQREPGEDAR
jgi:hypothetical protein